jgi:hypothetical protein
LPLERLIGFPFTGALENSGDFSQKIACPRPRARAVPCCHGFLDLGELTAGLITARAAKAGAAAVTDIGPAS